MPEGYCNYGSPILINLEQHRRDELTSVSEGVFFDITARGVRDRVAWTSGATRVGFLVMDRNGNGTIDDGAELFGAATPLDEGRVASSGFEALYYLDGGPTGSDWQVDSRDVVYSQLGVWIDWNHNGVSEPDELRSLVDAGISVIYTTYRETRRRDRHGNRYRFAGTAFVNRGGVDEPQRIFDVFFVVERL